MPKEIEITALDLIKRPGIADAEAAATGGSKNPFEWLKTVKDGIKQVKEIKDSLEQMGIDTSAITNLIGMKPGGAPQPDKPAGGQQLAVFFQVLKARYGELTINQLLTELKKEYGNKKLSELIK